jgi:hypothetical protein
VVAHAVKYRKPLREDIGMRWVENDMRGYEGVGGFSEAIQCSVCGETAYDRMYSPEGLTEEEWDFIECHYDCDPSLFCVCARCFGGGEQYISGAAVYREDTGWLMRKRTGGGELHN